MGDFGSKKTSDRRWNRSVFRCTWKLFRYELNAFRKDTVKIIFPFFPFLFWRFWVCEGSTLMRYCRNYFSLFFSLFRFSVKKFFFYFFIFLCVSSYPFGEKKKQKITFLGEKGKRKKINKNFTKHLCFILKTGFFPFFSVFPFFIREIFFQ